MLPYSPRRLPTPFLHATRVTSRALSALFLLSISVSVGHAASDDNYRIKPQTRLKVAIVEWISATGEYKEWTALNGEYVVSPVGTVSIPLIGGLKVLDETIDKVETQIGDALKAKTGLAVLPAVSVEVTRYPMIYVTGAVDRSGELEYRPGLTAMQAVAMAGGRERRQIPTGGYSEVDQIRYLGELNRYRLLLNQLVAKRARLQAELNERAAIDVPPELAEGSASDERIIDNEKTLFSARTQALARQLQAFSDLGNLLRNEIQVLDEKMTVQKRQIEIAETDLKVVARLVQSKALAKTRESSSERLVADLHSSMLDLVVASMRAKQKLSETDRDAITLKGQHKIEIGRDLQAVEADLEDTRLKRDTILQVLQITGAALSNVEDPKMVELQPVEYWVTRPGDPSSPFKVAQSTPLEPGDVLEVRLDLSSEEETPNTSSVRQTQ